MREEVECIVIKPIVAGEMKAKTKKWQPFVAVSPARFVLKWLNDQLVRVTH